MPTKVQKSVSRRRGISASFFAPLTNTTKMVDSVPTTQIQIQQQQKRHPSLRGTARPSDNRLFERIGGQIGAEFLSPSEQRHGKATEKKVVFYGRFRVEGRFSHYSFAVRRGGHSACPFQYKSHPCSHLQRLSRYPSQIDSPQ
ncbi:hypothetical protein Ddc_12197 [Ditylenchus destructor]|nr:hypothetical protein Ddc_12197 [Ditylenchus destructor]